MTSDQQRFFYEHLPHRVNLLVAFRERYSGQHPEKTLNPEHFRDLFRCAKDISMVMARFFCWEVGLKVPHGEHVIKPCPPRGTAYGATKVELSSLQSDPRLDSLRLVLIAANRSIAHIELSDVDHGITDTILVDAIDLVEEIVRKHIYPTEDVFIDAMKQPNNRM